MINSEHFSKLRAYIESKGKNPESVDNTNESAASGFVEHDVLSLSDAELSDLLLKADETVVMKADKSIVHITRANNGWRITDLKDPSDNIVVKDVSFMGGSLDLTRFDQSINDTTFHRPGDRVTHIFTKKADLPGADFLSNLGGELGNEALELQPSDTLNFADPRFDLPQEVILTDYKRRVITFTTKGRYPLGGINADSALILDENSFDLGGRFGEAATFASLFAEVMPGITFEGLKEQRTGVSFVAMMPSTGVELVHINTSAKPDQKRVEFGIIYKSATLQDALKFVPFFSSLPSMVTASDFIPE